MSLEIKFSENHIENMDITILTVEELLKNLDIDPLEVIVKKDDRVILVDKILKNKVISRLFE